jgi:lysozyme
VINLKRAEEQLILHEGLRLKPYLDTEGNWTLGVGYNITGRGLTFFERTIGRKLGPIDHIAITRAEALDVVRADILRVEQAVHTYFPDYEHLNEVRQRVCVDLTFNIGTQVLGFKKFIAAIGLHDWSEAAKQLYRSKWAGQVGDGEGGKFDRADRLAKMILTGDDYVT